MQKNMLKASVVAWLLLMPLFIGLLFISGVNADVTPTLDETSWTKGTIDGDTYVSWVISEAIDSNGYLHISYYDKNNMDLRYATNSNGVWRTEVVDSSGDVGRYNSIAVDTTGKVHISYYDWTDSDLMYATGNFGSWVISVVDSAGVVGEYNSIAVSSDAVYIIYFDSSNSNLKYAVKTSTAWTTDVVVEGVDLGSSPTYCDDQLHVAFLTSDYKLSYACLNGTEWTVEVVDTSSSFGKEVDIDVVNGKPCVAYYDSVTYDLKVAIRGSNGVWGKQVVDSTTNVRSWLSLDVDSSNRIHISYFDYLNQDLCYAVYDDAWDFSILDISGGTCSAIVSDYNDKQHVVYIDQDTSYLTYITNSGAKWIQETVDADGVVGEHSSIAVDAQGNIHIAYYDSTNSSLNYANNIDGWSVEVVDNSTPTVGLHPSLALDVDGKAHISYYDMTGSGKLKYATNKEGTWDVRDLDSSNGAGIFSSIAIDGNGAVHIAYLNHVSNNLKYTSNSGGDWIVGIIDNSGTVDGQVSLGVDSTNKVHVVYYRGGELIHANQTETGWAQESLESTDQLGGGVSMFIDDQDQIYVTYYNEFNNELWYINNVGGQWNSAELIDSEGNVGVGSSITVDENGDERIAYVGMESYGVLNYAERRNGIWMFQKVDLLGCGEHISMAMDPQGRAHISYYDPVTKDLKYASSVVVPSAPLNLTAVVSNGQVTLTWEEPVINGGANITGYRIYRSEAGGSTPYPYATISASHTTFIDLDLENGVTYLYRVRAINSEGSSPYSNEVEAIPCSLPGAPEVNASGRDKAVMLDWNEPDNGGAAIEKYNIYRKNESGTFLLIATVAGSETSYKDTGLENGVEYFYYVKAINPAGPGPESATVSATANPSNDMIIIAVVVIVILAAVGAGLYLLMRQRGGRR